MKRRVIDLTDAPLWTVLLAGAVAGAVAVAVGALIGFAVTSPIWIDWLVK